MCSACLTPVFPMEKMEANKLILHKNCFCCKHCKKQLSIHNYASLNGEFYCNSHYQQHFKREGNYDEGFGHVQHKDQWLQKNKATDELDAVSIPKMAKSKFSRESRESSANVLVTKSPARELGYSSGADVKGKLKVTWPPEKKSIGVNSPEQTCVKKNISDTGKASTFSMSPPDNSKLIPDNSKLKINHGGEKKDKMTTPSSSFILEAREKLKTTRYNSAEKLPSEEKTPKSDQTKAGHSQGKISQKMSNFSLLTLEKGVTVINQKTDPKNGAPISKTNYNSTSDGLDSYPNKARKSVQFSSNDVVAQHDLSSQLTTGAKVKERIKQLSDQAEQSKVSKSKDLPDVSDKNKVNRLSLQFRKQQSESKVNPAIPEHKFHVETSNMSNQESDVKVVSSLENPQTDIIALSEGLDKVEKSLDTQYLTETFNSTEKVVKQQEQSEIMHVIPKDFVNPCESENLSPPHSPAEHMSIQVASLKKNKNHFEKTDSANDQEDSDSKTKPVERTNSLKSSAKPTEKTKGKMGSWSKGKSPLSKLFTSGGNEKSNKTEPKDAKKTDVKPGGLLGRLFQSSFEKNEDPEQLAVQYEIKEKINADDKKTEKIKEEVTKEMQKKDSMSQEPPQEQEAGVHAKEKSHSAETDAKKPEDKPSGALLEGLSQSSLEKTEDAEQLAIQHEMKEKLYADDKKTEKIKEEVTKEIQKEDSMSQEPQEQETGEHAEEMSHSAETDAMKLDVQPSGALLEGLSQFSLEKTVDPEQLAVQIEMNEKIHADDNKTEEIKEEVTKEMQKEDSKSQEPPQEQETGEHAKEKSHSAETDAMKLDVQPSGALLEGLSQFSLEKTEDTEQLAVQDEMREKIHGDDEKTEKIKEEVTREMQGNGSMSQEAPQEQEAGEPSKEKSHSAETDAKKPEVKPGGALFEGLSQSSLEKTSSLEKIEDTEQLAAEPNTLNSNKNEVVNTSIELTDLPMSSTSEPQDDLTVLVETNANPTNNQESNLQSSEATGLSVTDPTITVQSVDQVSVESVDQFIAGKSRDEVLSAQLNDNVFGDSGISAPVDPSAIQINTDESAQKPNELLDAPGVEGGDLCSGALFDLNHEIPQNSSNPFGPPESQEIFVSTPGDIFSSSLSDTALSEADSAETFGLLVSQPVSTENKVMLGMTDQLIVSDSAPDDEDGDQSSNPFDASSQTREQGTDFDIFSSNDVLFTQSPTLSDKGGADAFTNQPSIFDNDIFGVTDISNSTDMSTLVPSVPDTSNSLNDLLGSGTSSSAAPSVQPDLFAADFFASPPQLLPVSEPSDVNLFVDSFFVSDNNSTQQTAENTVTSSSWMDDLLG